DLVDAGNSHYENGRFKEAANCYEEAIALHPGVANWHAKLAYTQLQLGDRRSALEHFEFAVKHNPEVLAWRVALSELQRQIDNHNPSLE
ncbi:tetratricopeptide repeat protein, partial [Flavonifractor plautii]|uniref:tetratricopeptide repeat protein n=1 Tax=Flavonifractor plautii TaxID=292800 RepID=UPI003D7ED0D4